MKVYSWSPGKNELLQKERGVSFEEIVLNIQLGNEVAIYDYQNIRNHPNQKNSVVLIEDYAYLVPYVENKDQIFLKTIIPSLKATKQYVGNANE